MTATAKGVVTNFRNFKKTEGGLALKDAMEARNAAPKTEYTASVSIKFEMSLLVVDGEDPLQAMQDFASKRLQTTLIHASSMHLSPVLVVSVNKKN